jgi:hypothetical protein
MQNINMFTDPTIGPIITVIFIICCLAGAFFIIWEAYNKNIPGQKKVHKAPDVRYEQYIVVDDKEILYPVAVVDHIDTRA